MTVESGALPEALDPLGVLLIRLGPDGTVLACNDTVVATLGIPATEIVGRPHQTLFGSLDVPRPCVVERSLFNSNGESCRVRWSINPQFDSAGMPDGMSCLGIEIPHGSPMAAVAEVPAPRMNGGALMIPGQGHVETMDRAVAQAIGDDEYSIGVAVVAPGSDLDRATVGTGVTSSPSRHFDVTAANTPASEAEFSLPPDVGDRTFGPGMDDLPSARSGDDRRQQSKNLIALKEVLKATSTGRSDELARAVLPRIAEAAFAHGAAVTFEIDGRRHVEFFGLPTETAPMIEEFLSRDMFSRAPLQALTRMNVLACLPLEGAKGQFGSVLLFSRLETELDADRSDALEPLMRSFAVSLENIVVTRQIETVTASRDSAHESILQAMVAALELRDHDTEGHTQRVTRASLQLGDSLGLSPAELRNLEHGALLHDVGKIGIPDAILHKPGPLSESEWEVMRRHPQYAYDILSRLPHLAHALDVPFCHHERFDGSGYPRGLVGSDIPLSARIFAVVDVYDAMTTERPYRPALPEEYAISHLKSHAGTHFDPIVVAAFTALLESSVSTEAVK